MISVLVNAYACAPNTGSEPGMAWNWIINLAKHCKLYVITEGEWEREIEEALTDLPQRHNIQFFYNKVSPGVREICWNQGDWRFYYYYRNWQRKTLKIAKEIITTYNIDILHQLNMIGFREPGYLWKIKGIPFVWGPIGGMKNFPENYLNGAPWQFRLFMRIKNVINDYQIKNQIRVAKALQNAELLISAIPETQKAIAKYHSLNSVLIPETGCLNEWELNTRNKFDQLDEFHILWVGKFDFRKQLDLAIKSLDQVKSWKNITLHIAGGDKNDAAPFEKLARNLGLEQNIVWHGKVPHQQIKQLMQKCHLFFFTSLSEDTSTVVLEAISAELPVLCFDTCGFGSVIDPTIGMKIQLSTMNQSIMEFAAKIDFLYENRKLLKKMSMNCKTRKIELSWDQKTSTMIALYQKMID